MKIPFPKEIPAQHSPLPRTFILLAALMIAGLGALLSAWGEGNQTFSQSPGLDIYVESGYPTMLPADGQSTTILKTYIDTCDFGVPIDSNGIFNVNIDWNSEGNDAKVSYLDGGLPDQPARFLLTASSEPGLVTMTVEISYCPQDAVAVMGICSDPAYANAKCSGTESIMIYNPVDNSQPSTQGNNPGPAQSESTDQEESESEEGQSEQGMTENETKPEITMAELYDDLEEFLSGEGITAPTPGQVGATGVAITTLLASWIVVNQMAGTSAETSLNVIKAWKDGKRPELDYDGPAIGSEAQMPMDDEGGVKGVEADPPDEVPDPPDPDATLVTPRTPVTEGGEDRLLRGVKDAQDLDDALKQTRKDFEAFQNKVPDRIKNSGAWKKHVAPGIKKTNDMIKKGELDKARTWLDRAEKLIEVRKLAERELGYLPPDKRDAIVWTERGLKTLGHVASDAYQTAVISPAKAAAEKILPPDIAKKVVKDLEELGTEISKTGQGISEMPRVAAQRITHGNIQKQLQVNPRTEPGEIVPDSNEDILDTVNFTTRKQPVDRFDPWGKGTRKAKELWDHTMRCLFHDR